MFKFFRRLMKKIIKKSFPYLVMKLQEIGEIKQLTEDNRNLSNDTRQSIEDIRRITEETRSLTDDNRNIIGDVRQLTKNLEQSVGDIRRITEETRSLTNDNRNIIGDVRQLTGEIKNITDNTKQSIRDIRRITEETRSLTYDNRNINGDIRKLTEENRNLIIELKQSFGLLTDSDFQVTKLKRMLSEVEYYQPAYMIGGINLIPQRECKDRCRIIEKSLNNSIAGLKILDIGSSLGYICFYFADKGAVTEGWESNPKNTEVARLIGQINGLSAKFKTKELYLESLDDMHIGEFDIIIILSVLHHIIHYKGLQYVQEIFKNLIDKVPILILELALKNEDETLFWNESQPENELAIFDLIKDEIIIEKIGEFPTHLSLKQRPLYKVSKKKNNIIINGKPYLYDKKTNFAYSDSEFPYLHSELSRDYYFSKKYIIKEYSVKIFDDNMKQITTEISNMLLLNDISKIKTTKLIDFEISNNRAVVVLARDDGDLISDILGKKEIDPEKVAKDVLEFLSVLEENNYHHNDIRSWNILWNDESAQVIDYGLMSPIVKDDDIISLLNILDAIQMKCKESSVYGIKIFPPKNNFVNPCLLQLYEIIEKGERSPKKLLEYLKTMK